MSFRIDISISMNYNSLKSASKELLRLAEFMSTNEDNPKEVKDLDPAIVFKDTFAPPVTSAVSTSAPRPRPIPKPLHAKTSLVHHSDPSSQGVEIDVNGYPWDVRINAKTKTKTQAGAWKLGRGIDPELVREVTLELKSAMQAPIVFEENPNPVPPIPDATIPSPDLSNLNFTDFITKIIERQSSNVKFVDVVELVLEKHGIASMALLNARLDLLPQIDAELEAEWGTLS